MKKTTFLRRGIVALILLLTIQSFAQDYVSFTPRFNQELKGDMLLIGNNILGRNNDDFNNNNVLNDEINMQYIDIDLDDTTFSSSSADLVLPNTGFSKIIYAGLYWSAVTKGLEPFRNIKFKGPSGEYNDITGTVIYDAGTVSADGDNSFPYVCYADVTSIVQGLTVDTGSYTVANVSSARGETRTFSPINSTGYSAGWSLFIVYEDATLFTKSIISFDGFTAISRDINPKSDISISGFRTPMIGPIRAKLAFAALEGDKSIPGDYLRINGTNLFDGFEERPSSNFFNSNITQSGSRIPNSSNTLGFDTGIIPVPNPSNNVIGNGDTSATIRLGTNRDIYFSYFNALSVDIDELLSTNHKEEVKVSILPNPTKGIVKFQSNSRFSSIELFDLKGIKVTSKKALNIQEVDLSKLSKGMYIMRLKDDNNNVILKKIFKD